MFGTDCTPLLPSTNVYWIDTIPSGVKFEMELSESMQNQYGKQFKGTPTPGKSNLI